MTAIATNLFGASRMYFRMLRNIQIGALTFRAAGYETLPPEFETWANGVLEALHPWSEQIERGATEIESSGASGKAWAGQLAKIAPMALDETVQIVAGTLVPGEDGTMGSLKGGPATAVLAFLNRITVKQIGKAVLIGLGLVTLTGTVILVGKKVLITSDPLDRWFEWTMGEARRHELALTACHGDPECEENENALHRAASKRIGQDIEGAQCGMFKTPIGTLLGGIMGFALGGAGVRRLSKL